MRALVFFVLSFLSLVTTAAHAGMKALVIIDMQDYFVGADSTNSANVNSMKTLELQQTEMIRVARSKSMPILLVSYGGDGPINQHILDNVAGYEKVASVIKTSDGLFDDPDSAALARAQLTAWGTTDLIIMGANGGYCVQQTIRGALALGYQIWSFENGIIDFNTRPFLYPYPYLKSKSSSMDPSRIAIEASPRFLEFATPEQTINFRKMPRLAHH